MQSQPKKKLRDEIVRTNGNLPIKPNQSKESHIREKNKTRAGKTRKINILFSSSLSLTRKFSNFVIFEFDSSAAHLVFFKDQSLY